MHLKNVENIEKFKSNYWKLGIQRKYKRNTTTAEHSHPVSVEYYIRTIMTIELDLDFLLVISGLTELLFLPS